jgi:hypothetical protein
MIVLMISSLAQVCACFHSSGSSDGNDYPPPAIVCDKSEGKYAGTEILDDLDVEKIANILATQVHRNIDTTIVQADKEGLLKL